MTWLGYAMTRLESGPAWGDRLYNGGICVGVFLFGMYFIYDHYIGYPSQNRREAAKVLKGQLGQDVDTETLRTDLSKSVFDAFQDARKSSPDPTSVAQLQEALGEPIHTKPESAAGSAMYYFASLYGLAEVPVRDARVDVEGMIWKKWKHTKDEIEQQFLFAFIPFAMALLFFYFFMKAALLRASMDDEALTYGGIRIPYERMTALKDYNPKGWIDLYYKVDEETERKLRIDNQKIAAFRPIIDMICEKTGFENELAQHEERMAAEDDEAFSGSDDQDPQNPQNPDAPRAD